MSSMTQVRSEGVDQVMLLDWILEAASTHQTWDLMVRGDSWLGFCPRAHVGPVEQCPSMKVSD